MMQIFVEENLLNILSGFWLININYSFYLTLFIMEMKLIKSNGRNKFLIFM